ncbi:ankyrin repeat-containing domain protein [Penicillium malachiteum]|uniref:Ankyrin repeat-containing domain protein n=1 Tax=Penicillium malachiteum TaxID=1324776 RepID=A0AAD6HCS6_9EURO|nr:ankyrin repeat-containing domain protein [Penicillium malachiteum]
MDQDKWGLALDQGKARLWIKGKPGSGKSTLLRRARDQVEPSLNGRGSPLILLFFFHGRGHELQRTQRGLFRSLLHQVLMEVEDALPDLVAALRQWQDTLGKDREEKQLKVFLESSLRKVLETRSVWLFIDALDECSKDDAAELTV